ncbi:unnamed protein product, partial [Closterium sp. NIES-54]
ATQRSSQGYTFSLGFGSVSWRSTRSSSVLGSSCEAEIYAGAMAAQELRWLTYLLTDLGEPPRYPPVLYVDNKAMLALCREHRLEHRTKHIALRYFLARELHQRGQLRLAYVASEANTSDIFTKALPPGDHQRFCTMLGFPTCTQLIWLVHHSSFLVTLCSYVLTMPCIHGAESIQRQQQQQQLQHQLSPTFRVAIPSLPPFAHHARSIFSFSAGSRTVVRLAETAAGVGIAETTAETAAPGVGSAEATAATEMSGTAAAGAGMAEATATGGAAPSAGVTTIGPAEASSAVDFLMMIQPLKTLKRTGWVKRGVQGPESIGDHMHRMALMAFVLSGVEGINRERCIKMAIVHDMAEAIAGDITPSCGVGKEEKHQMEKDALEKMCGALGPNRKAAAEMLSLWEEYEANETNEARLVKDFDKVRHTHTCVWAHTRTRAHTHTHVDGV